MAANFVDNAHFVGYDNGCDAKAGVNVLDQPQNGIRRGRVKGACGFIAQKHSRIRGQGPGNGHALFLAARKLGGIGFHPVFQANQLKQLAGALFCLRGFNPREFQGKTDVFQGCPLHQQIELLKDHAHGTPCLAQFGLGKLAKIPAFKINAAGCRPFKHIYAAHKGGFACAAFSYDAKNITLANCKIDITQSIDFTVLHLEFFFKIFDFYDRCFLHGVNKRHYARVDD